MNHSSFFMLCINNLGLHITGQLAVATQATMQGAFPFPGTQVVVLNLNYY